MIVSCRGVPHAPAEFLPGFAAALPAAARTFRRQCILFPPTDFLFQSVECILGDGIEGGILVAGDDRVGFDNDGFGRREHNRLSSDPSHHSFQPIAQALGFGQNGFGAGVHLFFKFGFYLILRRYHLLALFCLASFQVADARGRASPSWSCVTALPRQCA
jgi:hypothetical protein